MAELEKNVLIAQLFDCYGALLTETQKDILELYYFEDFSLAEIAEHRTITRQGVRDAVKHGEQQLMEYEEKLGLAAKIRNCEKVCGEIGALADMISEKADSGVVKAMTDSIKNKITEINNIF